MSTTKPTPISGEHPDDALIDTMKAIVLAGAGIVWPARPGVQIDREEQDARDCLDGYTERENARARRMRSFVRVCDECCSPIFESPGWCTQCAWENDAR